MPEPVKSLMLQECLEAPTVIRRQAQANAEAVVRLVETLRRRPPAFAATVARGSSDHACTVLKYATENCLGWPVVSISPSLYTLARTPLRLSGALVVAVSQSGASPDVVQTLRQARTDRAITVALVNVEDSELAQAAEFVLPLHCGEERAVAATKSYLASIAAFLPVLNGLNPDAALSRALDHLPERLEETLLLGPEAAQLAERYRFAENLMILARGQHYGVAQEAALKLKEICGIHAEAYSTAEFEHGPKRLLAEGVPLIGFQSSDSAAQSLVQAYAGLIASGADLRTIGPAATHLRTPATGHAFTDVLPSILAFYLFAERLAALLGLNPDQPALLQKVTRTL